MNIPNPHWPRWIFASTADYFKQAADGIELPILIEGIDEREAAKMRVNDHVEFRINGPAVSELSRGYFRLDMDVNLLLGQIGRDDRLRQSAVDARYHLFLSTNGE